jgi:hypothetical protein
VAGALLRRISGCVVFPMIEFAAEEVRVSLEVAHEMPPIR